MSRASRRLPARILRRLILSGVLGVALGAAAWSLGMDAWHAAGLGAAAFALSACLSSLGEAAEMAWAVAAPPPRPGSRRDVPQLGWSLGSRGGRASPEGVRRLRSVAERALAVHGLDLADRSADAQLEQLLGADVLDLLRRGSAVAPPRAPHIAAALTRLEALASSGPSAPRTPTEAAAALDTPSIAPTPEETARAR